MKNAAYFLIKALIGYVPPDEEQHRAKEREYWEKQLGVGRWLNKLTAVAAGVALCGIAVLAWQTSILQGQVTDTRNQISAFIAVPEMPATIVKMGTDWHFILDFHLANVGESTAREVYLDATLTMRGIDRTEDDYRAVIKGGPILISKSQPWSHVFDMGIPFNTSNYEFKGGKPVETGRMAIMPMRFDLKLRGLITYITVFREKISQDLDMVGGFTDARIACCNFLQLQNGVPMIYPADLTRISSEGPIKPN
jgi:hypothetical protein